MNPVLIILFLLIALLGYYYIQVNNIIENLPQIPSMITSLIDPIFEELNIPIGKNSSSTPTTNPSVSSER